MRRLRRSLAGVGIVALAAGALTLGVGGVSGASGNPPWEPLANPPEAGGLLFFNSAGQQITGGSTTTAPLAAYVEGTATLVTGDTKATLEVYTPASGKTWTQWAGGQLSSSTTYPNASAPAPLKTSTQPVVTGSTQDTSLATFIAGHPNAAPSTSPYYGLYELRVVTSKPGTTTSSTFDAADIEVTGTTWQVVYPTPSLTSTVTGLAVTPSGSQAFGSPVTLTATVTPAIPGTVQFEVGGSDIGTPVTVSNGTATIQTSSLPLGSDSLSAVFTPGQLLAYSGSTGDATYSVTPISTTTTLGAVPGSPQVAGTTEQLSATVTPAAPGTVQFKVGTTDIGAPVNVTGGTASISTSTLPVGSDSLRAVFTSSSPDYTGSTGTLPFAVTQPPGAPTTTALSVNPTSVPALTTVGLIASVVNANTEAALVSGSGTVKFYDDGSDATGDITSDSVLLGTATVGSGGTASITYFSQATAGTHNIVAEFVPADPTTLTDSTSEAVPFTSQAASFQPAAQDLDVSIPTGTLTITTPYSATNPFNLGSATLNPGGGYFTASAPFGSSADPSSGITITDTGIGENAWTASVSVTDFTSGGGTDTINGQNLTFTGVSASYLSGNAYGNATGDIAIDTYDVTNGGTLYAAGAPGTEGLKGGPHEFAASAAPGGGSVDIYGTLTLVAPSSVTPGTYSATLTFTVV